MILAFAAVCLLVLIVGVGWAYERRRSDACITARLREQVLVTLKSGASFSGVLYDFDAGCLVLVQTVEMLENVPVDGELLVRWADVAYVQKP